MVGLLDRTGVLRKRVLSPETSSGAEMVALARAEVARGSRHLHATFHSTTLLPGATPFVRSQSDRTSFIAALDEFLEFCVESGFLFRNLKEVAALTHTDKFDSGRVQ
jgi:hypothetical protein